MKVRISIEQADRKGFVKKIISKYHFEDKDFEQITKIYEQIRLHMEPYAMYKMNHRMTGLSMIDDAQTAMVALTLGSGIDSMKERFTRQGKLAEAYILDCLSNELLLAMYKEFNKSYAKFHRRYVQRYVFIGDEISPTTIPRMLDDMKGIKQKNEEDTVAALQENTQKEALREQEEICANEYGVLTPSKSVIFYALLSDNPNQQCEGICMGCGNVLCENRIKDTKQLCGLFNEKDERKVSQEAKNYGYMRIFGA